MTRRAALLLVVLLLLLPVQACQTRHDVNIAPVEVKPIHITIDVNVKIDKALEDFFGDIDAVEETIDVKPSSAQ